MTHSNQASLDVNLRLIWPQWQGGGTPSVQEYASDFPFDVARRGSAVNRPGRRCPRQPVMNAPAIPQTCQRLSRLYSLLRR